MSGDFISAAPRRAMDNRVALGCAILLVWAALSRAGELPLDPDSASANPAPPATEARDVLQFLDGSRLHGALDSMNPAHGVAWEHPDAAAPIHFKPGNIAAIRFDKPIALSNESAPTSRFRFNNGDEVFGHLAGISEEELELTTWFAGSMKTPRQSLQSIALLSKGFSILYEGPTSAEGWVHGRTARNWVYRDGAFVATGPGTLGRDLKLAGSSSVAFDLSWNGHFSLIMALYTQVLDRFDYSSSSYMFYLSPGYVTLQRVQGGAGAINLGQAQVAEMGRKNKLRMEIRANKEENTLGLFVDDRLVQRWKDSSGFVGQGSGIVFFAQLDGPSIRISNLKVAQWEGDLGMETATNAPSKDDWVYLVNRDKVSGRLQGLRDGVLTMAAAETSLDIPLSRVRQIWLGSRMTNAPAASPWEVRASFSGGGSVAFQLEEWDQGRVAGTSANFGGVVFDPKYIRQLQFNLGRSSIGTEGAEIPDLDVWESE